MNDKFTGDPIAPPPAKVYGAITDVVARIAKQGISKDRSNQQQNYKFRGIDDVYNALSGCLSEARLCILPRVLRREVTERASQRGGTLFYVVLDVEFDFVSAEDGSKHTVAVIGEAMDSGDKATNKAMSAAYKYACLQTFCIPTEGDNDADATTHEVAPHKTRDAAGDLSHVPQGMASDLASRMSQALDADVEESVKALKVYDLHSKVKGEPELYIAASELLPSKSRSAWKTYCKMAERIGNEVLR